MPDADDPWIDKDFESQVRDTAYFLWENEGRPHGREKDYWFAALDKCLRQRKADKLLRKGPLDTSVQADDNIDDLGRKLNDPTGERLDQPTFPDKDG